MHILIVGNVLKDVYLGLDSRTESFEQDSNSVSWLDFSFDASEHHFFNRTSNFAGAAVSLEVLHKMGIPASISNSNLHFDESDSISNAPAETYRYILTSENGVSYLVPSNLKQTSFSPPFDPIDYLFIDRSAYLNTATIKRISTFLDISKSTKLVLYLQKYQERHLLPLINKSHLIFYENDDFYSEKSTAPEFIKKIPEKIILIQENSLSYLKIAEPISVERIDRLTHLSTYSIAAATILGGFILGKSVEDSLKMARANVENSTLNSSLSLAELEDLISSNYTRQNDLELVAASLVLPKKGILAADESGGSIQKKFAALNIPDTFKNRHNYRNIFFTTPNIEQYLNGIILFDETARDYMQDGQPIPDFLISKRIIPGIKVDQGLEKIQNSEETYTKGLENLSNRLCEYYKMGLRFAKWRAAFNLTLNEQGEIITPSKEAITKNCQILAEYAKKCQTAGLVPIVEPELVYDGNYPLEKSSQATSNILDSLFESLSEQDVNLRACILKVNMVMAGKQFKAHSTPEEVGLATSEVLKKHIPQNLAGVVFLSGGQTPEEATQNLNAIIKNGPFPFPVTFSFARALQDPALYTWAGNEENTEKARQAFLDRLIANTKALE
jgi:fructose-bisphosphate aldolase class I